MNIEAHDGLGKRHTKALHRYKEHIPYPVPLVLIVILQPPKQHHHHDGHETLSKERCQINFFVSVERRCLSSD